MRETPPGSQVDGADSLIKHVPRRTLCSTDTELCIVPKDNLESNKKGSFSVIAP